jgi:hypothetical protein
MKSIIILLMYQQQRYSYITLKQDSRKNGVLGVSMQEMDKYLFLKEVIGLLFHWRNSSRKIILQLPFKLQILFEKKILSRLLAYRSKTKLYILTGIGIITDSVWWARTKARSEVSMLDSLHLSMNFPSKTNLYKSIKWDK